VLDTLLFGGESLLAHLAHPGFAFRKVDVADRKTDLAPLLAREGLLTRRLHRNPRVIDAG
jgi:hypothetical protein